MYTKVRKFNLKTMISFIEKNHVAVPEFQRGYVWKVPQVKKLFDSLIKKYPIGSFILWQTRQKIDARPIDGEALPSKKFLILDGQQRLLSLYYLCRQKVFEQHHVRDRFHDICDNRYSQLIDFDKFFIKKDNKTWFLDYDRRSDLKAIKLQKLWGLIGHNYMFPVIIVSVDDYNHAIEIFERINQAGTRLSTESIFLSETWTKHTDFDKALRNWKRANPKSLTHRVDKATFIHVFGLICQLEGKENNKAKISIDIKTLKKIAQKIRDAKETARFNKKFEKCIEAVSNAVQYLKEEYGIVSLSELPSQTLISVLAVFFYYNNKKTPQQQKELRKWFWRSSLSNRYIGSGYNKYIGPDAVDMKKLAKYGTPLRLEKVSLGKSYFESTDIRAGRSSVRNIVKLAIWKQGPKHVDGSPVNREDVETRQHKPEDDHFYPYHLYKERILGKEVNNILNIHFLNKKENIRKGKEIPSQWLGKEIEFYKNIDKGKIKKYFDSQLLPFRHQKDLKKFDSPFQLKKSRKMKAKIQARYRRFLDKRFHEIQSALNKLQNGN